MKRFRPYIFVLFASAICAGQSKSASQATYGDCSPNMSNNSGNVTIRCTGLDPAIADQIAEIIRQLSILNKKAAIAKNQQSMIKTLQEIKGSLDQAIARPAVEVNALIIQSSAGNCSPNIVGSGNTNICGPQALNINDMQADEITQGILAAPSNIPKGQISISLEIENHRTQVAGEALANALTRAGLDVSLTESYSVGSLPNNYGGITFMEVGRPADPLVKLLGELLNRLGVVSGPIPTFAPYSSPYLPPRPLTPNFSIIIRKPQE
jgi:hypothetical protein